MHGATLALLEQIAHARGATDEHLDEVGSLMEKNGRWFRPRPRARAAPPVPGDPISRPSDAGAELQISAALQNSMISWAPLSLRHRWRRPEGDFFSEKKTTASGCSWNDAPCCRHLHLLHEEDPEADDQQERPPTVRCQGCRADLRSHLTPFSISLLTRLSKAGVGLNFVGLEVPLISWPVMTTRAIDPGSACCMNSLNVTVFGVLELRRKILVKGTTSAIRTTDFNRVPEPLKSLFQDITACAGSVTRNASSIPKPATHTIRSVSSDHQRYRVPLFRRTSNHSSRSFLPAEPD